MARKDYEIAFQLSAHMNNEFQQRFNAANGALANLQNKIKEVNDLQKDVKAYEKQQAAVAATTEKLNKLKQEYEQLEAAKLKDGVLDADAIVKLAAKKAQIDKTTTSLDQQKQKLDSLGQGLQKAGVDTNNLSKEQDRLAKETEDLRSKQDEAAASMQDFGERGTNAINAVSEALAAAGIADALQSIATEFMNCVNTAAAFEETMSTVEALSGATSSEMEELSQLAKDLGAATQYSAQESAEAMTYMAMAGWDTEDMLSGMSGVMDLAAASGEDLATVSDIVTDSMTAFGLTASDTAHYADVLAAAATNSNTDVATMGETFQYCAPLAGALGYSVEDVATMVGMMANSGVKASNAGTALRTMFTNLTDGATLTSEAFGEYTIETQNADGTMRSLSDVITDLRSAFAQMSEAEKVANAETLVGKYAMTGFVTLMNSTEDDFDSLSESINNCSGAAAEMSEIKLDNMNGELELARSAWEGVTIAIGEDFTPIMSSAYGMIAEVCDALRVFIEENPAIVRAVAAGTAAFGALAVGIMGVSAAVTILEAHPVILTITAIAAAVGGLVGLIAAATTATNENVESVSELADAARDLQDTMDAANDTYQETMTSTQATADVASMYVDRLEEIEEATGGNVEGNQEYSNLLTLLCQQVPDLASYIDTETNSIEGGTEALREHIDAWKEDAKTQAQQEYINSLYSDYSDVLTEQAENEIKLTAATTKREAAEDALANAEARRAEIDKEIQKLGNEGGHQDEIDTLISEYYSLGDTVAGAKRAIKEATEQENNLNAAMEEDAAAVSEAEAAITDAQDAIAAMGDSEDWAAQEAEAVAEQTTEVQNRIAETTDTINALIEAYQEVYDEAYKSVSGQYALWDSAAEETATSIGTINSAMEGQISYWQDYNDNLSLLHERSGDIEGLDEVIASFADGSEDSVNAVAGMASATNEELEEMVANYRELQEEQDLVASNIADMSYDDLDEMVKEMSQTLADDIDEMNLSEEAADAGAETVQGYIDGINSKSSEVQAALAELQQYSSAALSGTLSDPTANYTTGTTNMPLAPIPSSHNASGTTNAAAGVSLVGENGPELVVLGGGETVLNNPRTKEVLTDGASCTGATSQSITYAPVLNLTGMSVTQEEAQSVLQEAQEKFESWFSDYIRQQQRLSFA